MSAICSRQETALRLAAPRFLRVGLLLSLGLLCGRDLRAQQIASVAVEPRTTGEPLSGTLPDAPSPMWLTATQEQAASQQDAVAATSSRQTALFPSAAQRRHHFLEDLLGPPAFIAPAFEAGIDTARPLKVAYPPDGFVGPGLHPAHGSVPEWGEGAQGYAKRYADRFGQGLIGTSTRYVLGEALREDVTYHRCACSGLLPRAGHAMADAYLARTRGGRTLPSLPALASPFVASEVAVRAWYPARFGSSDALRISLLNYVAAPLKNLFSEFIAH